MSSSSPAARKLTLTYNPTHHLDLDIYFPSPPPTHTEGPSAELPGVIYFHGGGMVAGSKSDLPAYLPEKITFRNILFLSVNHRLLYPSTGRDILDDIHALFAFLSSQSLSKSLAEHGASLDLARLGVFGLSGGNYAARAAATLSTVVPRPKAWVGVAGQGGDWLLDFWTQPQSSTQLIGLPYDPDKVDKLESVSGGVAVSDVPLYPVAGMEGRPDPEGRLGLYVRWQNRGTYLDHLLHPTTSARLRSIPYDQRLAQIPADQRELLLPITLDTPPTFLLHGTEDELVPFGEAQRTAEELRALGIRVECEWFEGVGHGVANPQRAGLAEAVWEARFDGMFEWLEGLLRE